MLSFGFVTWKLTMHAVMALGQQSDLRISGLLRTPPPASRKCSITSEWQNPAAHWYSVTAQGHSSPVTLKDTELDTILIHGVEGL